MISSIKPFFDPKGVAIIGASSKPNKLSYGILKNLKDNYKLGNVYPINLNSKEILGYKCFTHITEVPDPVDLAVIVIPAEATLDAIKACAKRGIKAVIIITGGFREVGESGKQLELSILEVAKENNMRIIGPNCVGTMDMKTGLNTTFIKGMPIAGPIGFVSQSGAVCGGVVDLLIDKQIGFSHFASLGNELDVSEADVIEYMGENPDVKAIAVYIEGVQNGERFMKVCRNVTPKKPIVLLKAGRSAEGAKAVSSHTGSLAGSYSAYQAAFNQCGVIEVKTIQDLFNVSWALGTQPLPFGNRSVIITNAGGPAALASDSLAENGLLLAELQEFTKIDLRKKLNPSAQVENPIDLLGGAEPEEYDLCLNKLNNDKNVDIVLPILVPQALVNPEEVANVIVKNSIRSKKTIYTCMMGEVSIKSARKILHESMVPFFQYPQDLGLVLGKSCEYRNIKNSKFRPLNRFTDVDEQTVSRIIKNSKGALGEYQTRLILDAYKIPTIEGIIALSENEVIRAGEYIGFPCVIKIVSDDILHKSDSGGIVVGISDQEELRVVYKNMIQLIERNHPKAKIHGVLVEKMAKKGIEVIIGMQRDKTFGPMIMFGMGGIYVELLKDVDFKIAPLGKNDAEAMVENTIAGKLLEGFRGDNKKDINAVCEVINRIAQLSMDFSSITEFEINPLVVYDDGSGVLSLDSRAIICQNL